MTPTEPAPAFASSTAESAKSLKPTPAKPIAPPMASNPSAFCANWLIPCPAVCKLCPVVCAVCDTVVKVWLEEPICPNVLTSPPATEENDLTTLNKPPSAPAKGPIISKAPPAFTRKSCVPFDKLPHQLENEAIMPEMSCPTRFNDGKTVSASGANTSSWNCLPSASN